MIYALDDLTENELAALHAYKSAENSLAGDSKCFEVNRELRNALSRTEMSLELRGVVDGLDQVFDRCGTIQDPTFKLYRGTGFRDHLPLHELGKRFRNLEFWSTSQIVSGTESFLKGPKSKGKNQAAILELRNLVGLPAYPLETLVGAGGGEAEILLPRGVLWQVVSAEIRDVPPFYSGYLESLVYAVLEPVAYPPPFSMP